jgi:hypothetical protein
MKARQGVKEVKQAVAAFLMMAAAIRCLLVKIMSRFVLASQVCRAVMSETTTEVGGLATYSSYAVFSELGLYRCA